MPNYLFTVHSKKGMVAECEPAIILADNLQQAEQKIQARGLSLDTIQEITDGIRFEYYALDVKGQEHHSYIYANNQSDAIRLIIKNGYFITSIQEVPEIQVKNTSKYKTKKNLTHPKRNASKKSKFFIRFNLAIMLMIIAFLCMLVTIFVVEEDNNSEAFTIWMQYHNYPEMTFEDWKTLKDANALPTEQKKHERIR